MQFAGFDFPNCFTRDNFTSRRTTGHNMHDPESLISGAELARGLTYTNSRRAWRNEAQYLAAVTGKLSTHQILEQAPRIVANPLVGIGLLARDENKNKDVFIPNRLEQLQEMSDGE